METPTINKSQKRSTLSAKKTKVKETIKNVVATPYNNYYWPRVSDEDNAMLKLVLENNLPKIKPDIKGAPWRLLKNIPKSERKKFRNEYVKKHEIVVSKDRDGLTFGINSVTKQLEQNLLSAILISNSVQPKIMVQHVIDGAVLYKTPVIVLDDLKNLTSKICGIPSTAVGINKCINADSKLNSIKECVVQIFEKVAPPVDHINYKRSLQVEQENVVTDISQSDTFIETKAVEQENLVTDTSQLDKFTETKEVKEENLVTDISESNEIESTIYLKRQSNGKRVFVPETSRKTINIYKMEIDSSGFLPFSDAPVAKTAEENVKANYKSLIVKRLKGDPNRNKRKIASFKRKLK